MVTHTDFNRNNTLFLKNAHKSAPTNLSSIKNKAFWDDSLPVPNLVLYKAPLVIFVVAILCFGNSLLGDFVFDDSEAIVNNSDLKPETPILNLFRNDFWGTKLTHNNSHKSYRPVTVLTFRLNYYLTGLHPFSFHLVNILLHGVVSVLVLHMFTTLFTGVLGHNGGLKAACICALLFAVHPVHTESVSAVVGRADLLCGIFFLLSFIAYTNACSSASQPCIYPVQFSLPWLGLSLVLAGISMLCKEQGITVIGICSAYDIIILCRIDALDLFCNFFRQHNTSSAPSKKWILGLALRQLLLAAGGSVLLLGRWHVMDSSTPVFQKVDNPASFEDSILVRAINFHYIYALNAWLFLHPLWLCFDWSMGCVPLIRVASDPRILVVFLFWLAIGMLLFCCLTHWDRKVRRLMSLTMAFILVPFLPASNLFFKVGFVVAERALYLPSLGFCLLFTIGLRQLCISLIPQYRLAVQVCIVLLFSVFIARSIHRSSEWKTEEILFTSGLKVCPLNAKVHYNIAKNAADGGNREKAIQEYRKAIKLNPYYDQAMNNLANILKDLGHLVEAEQLLHDAIRTRPDFAAAWMNLGIVQSSLSKVKEAEKSYLAAIQYRRFYPDCFYNLGNLYLDQERYEEAYKAWRNATTLQPSHLVAWNNMIIMLDSIGNLSKAEAVAHEALHILPSEASLHFNLANTLGKRGKYEESEKHFLFAIELNNDNPNYYTNLGVLYHRWKRYNKAETAYMQALQLNPNMKSAQENLRLLYKTLERLQE